MGQTLRAILPRWNLSLLQVGNEIFQNSLWKKVTLPTDAFQWSKHWSFLVDIHHLTNFKWEIYFQMKHCHAVIQHCWNFSILLEHLFLFYFLLKMKWSKMFLFLFFFLLLFLKQHCVPGDRAPEEPLPASPPSLLSASSRESYSVTFLVTQTVSTWVTDVTVWVTGSSAVNSLKKYRNAASARLDQTWGPANPKHRSNSSQYPLLQRRTGKPSKRHRASCSQGRNGSGRWRGTRQSKYLKMKDVTQGKTVWQSEHCTCELVGRALVIGLGNEAFGNIWLGQVQLKMPWLILCPTVVCAHTQRARWLCIGNNTGIGVETTWMSSSIIISNKNHISNPSSNRLCLYRRHTWCVAIAVTSVVLGLLCARGRTEAKDKSLHQRQLGWRPAELWGFSWLLLPILHHSSNPFILWYLLLAVSSTLYSIQKGSTHSWRATLTKGLKAERI